EGVGAVERGGGAAHDLDAVDDVDGDELLAEEVAGGGAIVDGLAVDHELEDVAGGVLSAVDAADADVVRDAVVDVIEAGDGAQDVGEAGVAARLDLVGVDDGDDGWRLGGVALGAGGDLDRRVEQLFERDLLDIRDVLDVYLFAGLVGEG